MVAAVEETPLTGGRLILWHALGGGTDAAFVGTAMRELIDLLRTELPAPNLTAEPLNERHEAISVAVRALDYGDLDGCAEATAAAGRYQVP